MTIRERMEFRLRKAGGPMYLRPLRIIATALRRSFRQLDPKVPMQDWTVRLKTRPLPTMELLNLYGLTEIFAWALGERFFIAEPSQRALLGSLRYELRKQEHYQFVVMSQTDRTVTFKVINKDTLFEIKDPYRRVSARALYDNLLMSNFNR